MSWVDISDNAACTFSNAERCFRQSEIWDIFRVQKSKKWLIDKLENIDMTELLGAEFRSNVFHYFKQECYLAKSLLGNGLRELYLFNESPYSEHGIGHGYAGFFHLSISIERLGKLALIFYYAKNNSNGTQPITLPSGNEIRKVGHDLNMLFNKLEQHGRQEDAGYLDFNLSRNSRKILDFLGKFADKSRYENLDKLSGSGSINDEPLKAWEIILKEIINNLPHGKYSDREDYEFRLNSIREQRFPKSKDVAKKVFDLSNGQNEIISFIKSYSGISLKQSEVIILEAAYQNYFICVFWHIFEIVKPIVHFLNKWAKECYEINEKYVYAPFKNVLKEQIGRLNSDALSDNSDLEVEVLESNSTETKPNLLDIPEVWEIFSSAEFQISDLSEFIKIFEQDNSKKCWFKVV